MQQKLQFWKTKKGKLIIGLLIIVAIAIPLTVYILQQQQNLEQEASCINNDVIYCGATTKAAIINAMRNGDSKGRRDIASIFSQFGITEDGINSSNTVAGRVYKDGRITIGADQVVATGALTAGREDRPGSTRCGPLYCRPPTVTFTSPYGNALVHVENGVFKWAILTGCGNPVIVPTSPTPTFTPTPTLTVTPTISISVTPTLTHTPTPTLTVTPTVTVTPTGSPSATPTVTVTPTIPITVTVTQTPTPTATPTPPQGSTSTPTTVVYKTPYPTLPPTGPEALLVGIGTAAIMLMFVGGLLLFLL